jgi:predicted dehydrogenase
MLAKEKIDILSICTPPGTHYHILKEAVKFPLKAIFCEKPLSDNLVDAEKMLQLCKRKRVILQVDHQRRFDPLHICLKDYLADKISGQIQQVNFYYTAGIKNTGSHMFDLLRFFFGEVDWMEAFFSRNDSGRGDDPNLDGILKFHNGILGVFQACNAKKYLIFELDCFLEAGKFSLKNSGFSLDFYRAGKSKYFSGYRELSEAKSPFKTNYKRNFMANAVRHLADCVRMGRESNSSGRDGLAALKLIDAAIWSAKNNGKRIFIR